MSIFVERLNTNSQIFLAFEIYEDSCTGNRFKCIAPSQVYVNYFNTDFVIGRTYYIRVVNPSNTITTAGFNICVQALPKPANDACANATELNPTANCVTSSGTFSGALLEGTAPSCANSASQDVWYRFTATSQNMSINITRPTTNYQISYAFEIYEDSCNGNLLQCIAPGFNAVTYSGNSLVIGRTYYVRVVNPTNTITTLGFNICLMGPPPVNCTPSVAISASTNSICQGESVSFEATPVNGGTSPGYQWKINGNNAGTNSASFTTSALTNGSIVSCVMTSNAACAFPTSATSNGIAIDVTTRTIPTFTAIGPICAGETFALQSNSNEGISGTWAPSVNNQSTTTYSFTPTSGQCAAATTFTVMVTSVNAQVTTQGNTITASATNATYQWINCGNNQAVNGATSNTFTPAANGSYAVIVTQNGCSKTSNCVNISTLETDGHSKFEWKIYPNPANNHLFIDLKEETTVVIADMLGKTLQRHSLKSGNNIIDVSQLASGMYVIKSASGANSKFIKK